MQKTILTLIFMIGCFFSSHAQTTTDFTIFSENGERFIAIVEGAQQNAVPQARVVIPALIEGRYRVKINFEDNTVPALNDFLVTTGVEGQMGSVTYVIKKNGKGNFVMRTSNWSKDHAVVNGAYPNQNYGTTQTAPPQGEGQVTTTQSTTYTTTGANPGGANVNINVNPNGAVIRDPNGNVVNMNVNMDPNGMNMNTGVATSGTTTYSTTTTTTTSGYVEPVNTQQQGYNNAGGYAQGNNCLYPMAPGDFSSARASIEKQSFAEEKMKIAKQVVKAQCVSSGQIKEIMGLFSFEDNKLDFAKFAYDFCVDKQNYYKVNDAFGFSSSVDALNSYLDGRR